MKDYVMSKELFDTLVEQLNEHQDSREIITGFTSCLLDMMNNDSDFLSIKHNRKLREKVVQFQLDLLDKTKY